MPTRRIDLFRHFLGWRERLLKGISKTRFISYPHADARQYAAKLRNQLQDLDYTCFFDEDEAPPGSSLSPTLVNAIKKSAVFVLVGTERTLTRPYIGLELARFAETGRTIIPIDVDNESDRALTESPWSVITEVMKIPRHSQMEDLPPLSQHHLVGSEPRAMNLRASI